MAGPGLLPRGFGRSARREQDSAFARDAGETESASRSRSRFEHASWCVAAEAAIQNTEHNLGFGRPEGLGQDRY